MSDCRAEFEKWEAAQLGDIDFRVDVCKYSARLGFEAAYALRTPDINQLVEALKSIAANTCCDTCQEAKLVAQSALSALEQPRLETCPKCGGVADNGHDRELPPNPYLCSKCEQPAVSQEDRK